MPYIKQLYQNAEELYLLANMAKVKQKVLAGNSAICRLFTRGETFAPCRQIPESHRFACFQNHGKNDIYTASLSSKIR